MNVRDIALDIQLGSAVRRSQYLAYENGRVAVASVRTSDTHIQIALADAFPLRIPDYTSCTWGTLILRLTSAMSRGRYGLLARRGLAIGVLLVISVVSR